MICRLPMLLLAGCPYVFGPADLSNVPGPDPTGDTASDTDPTGPTGDTGPVLVGPVVTDVLIRPLVDGLDLAVSFTPPGALASGGTLLVSVDGAVPLEVLVPGDARLVGTSVVRWTLPVTALCDGFQHELSVSIRDPLATGPVTSVDVDIHGLGTPPEQQVIVDLGEITPPVVFCGIANMVSELDKFSFRTTAGGTTQFVLSWVGGPNTDLDYAVTDGMAPYPVAETYNTVNPEVVSGVLVAGTPYELTVTHFAGPPPFAWQMAILPGETGTTTGETGDTGATGDTGP